MALYNLTEFLKISSVLNYNLSASSLNRYNVLTYIMDDKRLHPEEQQNLEQKGLAMEALNYLFNAYSEKSRRLGPMAILHPLRATALFCRAFNNLTLTDILSLLFHDVPEDIRSRDYEASRWNMMEAQMHALYDRMDTIKAQKLKQRLDSLTKRDEESYFSYIGRLLDSSKDDPMVVQIKMADRLDNTLDMRIDIHDPLEEINFFETFFQILFQNNYKGHMPKRSHPPSSYLNGSKRLYQLFKNTVLLSLIRKTRIIEDKQSPQILFNAIAEASLNEAQRILIHLIDYHYRDVKQQRAILLEVLDYCYSGKSCMVTRPDSHQQLDGLFYNYFGIIDKDQRNQQIAKLYQNKPLMMQASVAFIVIFLSFLDNPGFYVKGISNQGVTPE